MSIQQTDKYLKKDKLWPKFEPEDLVEKGYDKIMALYVYRLRNCLPAKPVYRSNDNESVVKTQKEFILFYDIMKYAASQHLKYKEISQTTSIIYKELVKAGFLTESYVSRYSVTPCAYNLINKKLIKHLSYTDDDLETEALNAKGYLTPRERAAVFLKVIPLTDYEFHSMDKDGMIKLCKAVRYGSTTSYHYEKVHYDRVSIFLEKYSLSPALNMLSDSIGKLFKNVKMYGLRYNRYIGSASYNLFVITDDLSQSRYEGILDKFEKVEKECDIILNDGEEPAAEVAESVKKEPESSNRKQRVNSNLSTISREGATVRNRNAVGQDFIDTFGIRGGEFGNWVNEEERQLNMNMCYDSFADLALILGIPKSAIAMGHKLNIAFGARGSGNALAHYEPAREVINLTRMKGAGSLAHEYFHAIDDLYAKSLNRTGFASNMGDDVPTMKRLVNALKYKEVPYSSQDLKNEDVEYYKTQLAIFNQDMVDMIPDSTLEEEQIKEKNRIINELLKKTKEGYVFIDLSGTSFKVDPIMRELFSFINKYSLNYRMTDSNKRYLANKLNMVSRAYQECLKTKEPTTKKKYTDFSRNADKLSGSLNRKGHGYWNSNEEMCARAFACYVKDKLAEKGMKNDYLCGHAEMVTDGDGVKGYPVGEERIAINKAFDEFFADLKKEGFFHA